MVYPNLVHFVTMEGTGINKLSDIKGKRISTSAPVSGSEVMALRIIDELGLKLSDIKRERLSPAESTNAMKDGKLDGYFFNGGPPVAAITDLAATQGVKIKLIPTADLVPALNKKYGPVFAASQIHGQGLSEPGRGRAGDRHLEHPGRAGLDERRPGLHDHQDAVGQPCRPGRHPQGVDRHDGGEPEGGEFVGARSIPAR